MRKQQLYHLDTSPATSPPQRSAVEQLIAHIHSRTRTQERSREESAFLFRHVVAHRRYLVQHRPVESSDQIRVAPFQNQSETCDICAAIKLRVPRIKPGNVIPEGKRLT